MWRTIILVATSIFMCLAITSCAERKVESTPVLFGELDNGQKIYLYTLTNDNGMSVEVINYGARVRSIKVPDKDGNTADVILGFDDLEGYVKDNSFQGAIVGRYGNRIADGKFTLDGKEYQLTVNSGENHLHGGFEGFYRKVWTAEQLSPNSLRLNLESPDGEEGYPGNVKITVTYTVTKDNGLKIEYTGTTDKPTILNPTSHCYFNLTGNPDNTILDHLLMIDADMFTPVNDKLIPTGKLEDVEGTPMDFREPKAIGNDISDDFQQLEFGMGYDHNWVLNNYDKQVHKVASLYDPESGRYMEVSTDQPGLQFYSGNFLDGTMKGKGGQLYAYRTALCLEAQKFPDSPNEPDFPSAVLRPGEKYTQTTIYKFSTK